MVSTPLVPSELTMARVRPVVSDLHCRWGVLLPSTELLDKCER